MATTTLDGNSADVGANRPNRLASLIVRGLLPLERLAAKLGGPRLLLEIDVGALIGTGLLRRVEAAT